MGFPLILLDLDDTLGRSDTYEPAFLAAAEAVGVQPDRAQAHWRASGGQPLAGQLAALLGPEARQEQITAACAHFWSEALQAPFIPLEGADQTLRQLAARGHRLFLSTGSSPERVQLVLERTGWSDLFELALGSQPGCQKGPDHYRCLAAQAGCSLAQLTDLLVSVGDGAYDIRYAKAHKVYAVGFTPPGTAPAQRARLLDLGADELLVDLRDLPDLVR